MRFLVDTNLPRALCAWLGARGYACQHVLDVNLAQAGDMAIWNHAVAADQIIISKDEDFSDLALRTRDGPSVVWVRTGNGTNRQLFSYLYSLWPQIETRLNAGDRLVEVR